MDHAADREETTELRKDQPSGWLHLTQHDAILVDALLDLPPDREFNKTEFAGVTRQTVGNYTDLLLDVELIDQRRPHAGIGLQTARSFGNSSS